MTRKDYILFAQAFRGFPLTLLAKEGIDWNDYALGYTAAVQQVVNVLKSDNPSFDEDMFIKAILK